MRHGEQHRPHGWRQYSGRSQQLEAEPTGIRSGTPGGAYLPYLIIPSERVVQIKLHQYVACRGPLV